MNISSRFSFIVGSFSLLVLLLLGTVVGFSLLQTRQDVRNKASVKEGVVSVTLAPPPQDVIATEAVSFDVLINTHGAAVDAVQLEAMLSGVPMSAVTFTPATDLGGLKLSVQNVTQSQLELVFTLATATQPFITTSEVSLGKITGVPQQAGKLRLDWDNASSKVTLYRRAVDGLQAIQALDVVVLEQPTAVKPTDPPVSTTPIITPQRICEGSGGVWRQYSDSCADTCGVIPGKSKCTEAFTFACDCGSNACWDGQSCSAQKATPTPLPTAKPTAFPDPTYPPYRLIYDLNKDGNLNLLDLTIFIRALQGGDAQVDFNRDQRVNILDYTLFIQQLAGKTFDQ